MVACLTRYFHKIICPIVFQIEPDALLTKMQQLCVRMNVDKQPSSCEIAMEYLRKAFNRPEHRQTLVILDDVWSSDMIRYFDVGCRIIVITKDLSVVDPFTRRNEPIEVSYYPLRNKSGKIVRHENT